MNEQEVLQVLGKVDAVIADSHIVYTSGKHGKAYVNKDAVYPHTKEISDLCQPIAEQFVDDGVETVIGPTVGGVILSHCVARHLSDLTGREVLSVYADKTREYREGDGFDNIITIRQSFHVLLNGKRVLVVDDVLTTERGRSAEALCACQYQARRVGRNRMSALRQERRV